MVILSPPGSSFFGFVAEYLVLIPMLGLVGDRLGYGRLFALAVVGVAAKVGYMTSITNPFALRNCAAARARALVERHGLSRGYIWRLYRRSRNWLRSIRHSPGPSQQRHLR